MNKVIICGAFGYDASKVSTLLRSAADAGVRARIVLLKERPTESFVREVSAIHPETELWTPGGWRTHNAVRKVCRMRPARLLSGWLFDRTWDKHPRWRGRLRKFAPCLLHVMLARFFYAEEFLAKHRTQYDQVLLCDARDVVFQADPFRAPVDSVINGVESSVMKDNVYNSQWIYRLYDDPETLRRLSVERVLCAGVTLGPTEQILTYLSAMMEEMCEKMERACLRSCLDQGMHNRILREAPPVPLKLSENGRGCIATIGGCQDLDEFQWDDERGLLTQQGEVIPIVHQYDRHPELSAYFERRYSVATEQTERRTAEPVTA